MKTEKDLIRASLELMLEVLGQNTQPENESDIEALQKLLKRFQPCEEYIYVAVSALGWQSASNPTEACLGVDVILVSEPHPEDFEVWDFEGEWVGEFDEKVEEYIEQRLKLTERVSLFKLPERDFEICDYVVTGNDVERIY